MLLAPVESLNERRKEGRQLTTDDLLSAVAPGHGGHRLTAHLTLDKPVLVQHRMLRTWCILECDVLCKVMKERIKVDLIPERISEK